MLQLPWRRYSIFSVLSFIYLIVRAASDISFTLQILNEKPWLNKEFIKIFNQPSVRPYIHLPVCLCLTVCPSGLPVCLPVCLSVCLSLSLFLAVHLFDR